MSLRSVRTPELAAIAARRARARPTPGSVAARRRARRLLLFCGAVGVLLILAVGVFAAAVWLRIDRVHLDLPGSRSGTTYLLVGSDSRAAVRSGSDIERFGDASRVPGERADVVLLVHRSKRGRTRVMSVPRDLVVMPSQGGPTRIALTLLSGLQELVDVTCRSLGIGVDHVAVISFDGLRRSVDASGGVTVRTDAPLRDRTTGLELRRAGIHHLDGQEALSYVRSRTAERFVGGAWIPEPPSISVRAQRARQVLGALGARAGVSPLSPFDMHRKLWAFSGAIRVDDEMDPIGLRSLADTMGHLPRAFEVALPATPHTDGTPEAVASRDTLAALRSFQASTRECDVRLPTE